MTLTYDPRDDGQFRRTIIEGTDGNGDYHRAKVNAQGEVAIAGSFSASPATSSSASVTRVATSNVSAQLLAANVNRVGVIIVNESAYTMYVKYGTTASPTDYTYRLPANSVLEIGFGWIGRIDAVLNDGTGAAQITEMFP